MCPPPMKINKKFDGSSLFEQDLNIPHIRLNSFPIFHIFDFSNREEDLKDKIRLLLASSQNKLKNL